MPRVAFRFSNTTEVIAEPSCRFDSYTRSVVAKFPTAEALLSPDAKAERLAMVSTLDVCIDRLEARHSRVRSLGRQTHRVCVFKRLRLRLQIPCLPVFVFAGRQTLGFFQMSFCGCLGRNPCLPGRQTLGVCWEATRTTNRGFSLRA